MMRLLIATAFSILVLPGLALSAGRKISAADGDALAKAMIDAVSVGGKAKGYALDGDPPDPNFLHLEFFSDYCCSSEGSSHYILDLYTGDGWDGTTCKEIKSRKLERLRRAIRHRIGLTDKRYREIKITLQPCN